VSEAEFTSPAPAGSSPVEYATFARRLGAALLDSLVWIVGLSFFNPVVLVSNEAVAGLLALVILSLWFNYFAFCEWRWGQTIGKNATGIRVLPLEGGEVTWQAAALRNLLRLVDLPLAMVGVDYLIVNRSPRRQRLGDRAAKTIVVREAEAEAVQPLAAGASAAGTPAPPYGGAGAPTAADIFGDAAEALGRHPAAASIAPAAPEPAQPPATQEPPPAAAPGSGSSWTAAGFPYADWELRRTVLGLAGGLLLALFTPLLILPFDPDLESTGALLAAQALFAGSLVLVSIGIASGEGRKWDTAKALSLLGLRGFKPSALGWMALAYVAYFIFVAVYGTLITPPEQEDIARELGLDTGPVAAVAVVFVIAVLAPISEEIFFRGMLFGGLRRRLPTIGAAAISAVVFGALHAPTGPTAVPPLIAFGFVLALLYERSGSLGPPIILHAINNSLALALTA